MKLASVLVILSLAAAAAVTESAQAADLDRPWGGSPHRHHGYGHHVWRAAGPPPALLVAPPPSGADVLVFALETPPPEMLVHHDRLLPPGVIYNVPVQPSYARGPVIRANY